MKTELLDATPKRELRREIALQNAQEKSIARAADLLKAGELVAFPTDTVYGVGAIFNQPCAVARLYIAKGRPTEKAIPILLADVRDLHNVVAEVNDTVRRLINHFWPGGLTLVLPKSVAVPPEVSPTHNVAVRLPNLSLTREIIAAAGAPLAVTSANRSGQRNPLTADDVEAQLGGRIAAVLDGGACPGGIPSTILDCTMLPPHVLRVGAVPVEALRRFTTIKWPADP